MNNTEIYFENINQKQVFAVADFVDGSKKLVIMSHGFRGDSCGPARQFVEFARLLNTNGISTLRFDQPNSGNSDGAFLDSSFKLWVNTTAHFTKKCLEQGYQISLMGQSMGASTSVIASAQPEIEGKISALLLWVPDPKSTTFVESDKVYEEGGQLYRGAFWQEARESNFFKCINKFKQPIHLVYGQNDKYVSEDLRTQVMETVKKLKGEVEVLPGEDHSPWQFETAKRVMEEEVNFLENIWK